MRLKTLGKSPFRIHKFTDHGPNTGSYGPHVDQSECRILQSRIIKYSITLDEENQHNSIKKNSLYVAQIFHKKLGFESKPQIQHAVTRSYKQFFYRD